MKKLVEMDMSSSQSETASLLWGKQPEDEQAHM